MALSWSEVESVEHDGMRETVQRAVVPNGWLVKYLVVSTTDGVPATASVTYVDDPDHEWLTMPVEDYTVFPVPETTNFADPAFTFDDLTLSMIEGIIDGSYRQVLRYRHGAQQQTRFVPVTVRRLLDCIDGRHTVAEVIARSDVNPELAAQIIRDLLRHGILETSHA